MPPFVNSVSQTNPNLFSISLQKLLTATSRKSLQILSVLERYQLPVPRNAVDRSDEGLLKFLPIVHCCVRENVAVRMVLPAFPFKSPNKVDKVLGTLPDKGEEFALAHLNGICEAIKDVYPAGARLLIASDGLVYNDLLDVPDSSVWVYGQDLRAIAQSNGYKNIEFMRLQDLLGLEPDNNALIDETSYIANAASVRELLLGQYLPSNFSPETEIATDEDMCATYRGYIKFLSHDLAYSNAHTTELKNGQRMRLSKSAIKKRDECVAKHMIRRGKAFAAAIDHKFGDHVRLSIHPSSGAKKFSISLSPYPGLKSVTPWHSSIRFDIAGTAHLAHKSAHHDLHGEKSVETVYRNGQPWMLREKNSLFDWSIPVDIEPMYPTGVMITPKHGHTLSITCVDFPKLRAMAEHNSPVVLRGFSDTTSRETFLDSSHKMGTPVPWLFGLVLEVKDRGVETRGLNNVLSYEPMPMHYDGLFKTTKAVDATTGTERNVLVPAPRLQFFVAVTPSPPDTGYTLFASSRRFFQHVPAGILDGLTWRCRTMGFEGAKGPGLTNLPLVVPHPRHGYACLRYHEPWRAHQTRFDATEVAIEGVDADESLKITDVVDAMLYDRRVCYWHAWVLGDVLVSDNVQMMHTRTQFTSGADRELWRIHVD